MAIVDAVPGETLTSRQRMILKCIANGLTMKETSDFIHFSFDTIKGDVRNLYIKLEAKNAAHAVLRGCQEGYLP